MPPVASTPAAQPDHRAHNRTHDRTHNRRASQAYCQFQRKLARHAILRFVASLRGSTEVVLLVAGQALLGTIALLSGPLWLCVHWSQQGKPALHIIGLWLAFSLLMCLPLLLLRKRLLPREVALWSRSLPLPPGSHFSAHLATASLFMRPLLLLLGLSSAALLSESPALMERWWLGLLLQLSSVALTWVLCAGILQWRLGRLTTEPDSRARRQETGAYQIRALRPAWFQLWYRLFWLPFWRLENGIGIQQCLLFASTCLMFVLWCYPQVQPLPRGILGWFASTLILILTDRGFKAVQEQMHAIELHLRALPLRFSTLKWLTYGSSLLPAALITAGFGLWLLAHAAQVHAGVARWYLGTQVLAHLALLACARMTQEARARVLILGLVILTAMGTELWQ